MAGLNVDPGVISAEALEITRVLAMNDGIGISQNLIQQGNMIPGLNEIAQQVIRITSHSVAMHSRVDGLISRADKISTTADDVKAKIASLA